MTLQEYEVKRVEPFSFGKISAAFASLGGLITGLIYLPFITFMSVSSAGESAPVVLGGIFLGLLMTFILGFVYAGVGFAMGVFYGYAYNYLASKIGGLEMVMDIEG